MKFVQRLAERRPLLLDGAMGTMLQASGLPAGVSPEEFCMERPDILQGIHKAYLDAGVDIITSCTFGGNPCKLPASLDVFTFNKRMVETARAAAAQAGRPVFVAGNVGPSGHFARPLGDMEPEELIKAFSEQIRGLVAGGADLIFIETQFDLAEARAAVTAARQVCDLPVMVSMTFEQGVSLTGSSPTIFAETMQNMGVAALGTNCSLGPDQMLPVVEELLSVCSCPVVAEPNAGLPELRGSETVFPLGPEAFAQKTAAFAARGARVLGGCCGTTPQHLAALRQALESVTCDERPVVSPSGICLTSRSQLLRLGEGQPFSVIGERINPTGKKKMKEALRSGNHDYVMGEAISQTEAGAQILDVNAGLPEIDERATMVELVAELQGVTTLPLQIDSADPSVIEAAVRAYPGKALINSTNGKQEILDAVLPIAKHYGCAIVGLTLDEAGIPPTAEGRVAVARKIVAATDAAGIPRQDVVIDCLCMAASTDQSAPRAILDAISGVKRELPGVRTVLGLSNISFGLPFRPLVNATFLSAAFGAGLDMAIMNPLVQRMMDVVDSWRVLSGEDENAQRYVANYAERTDKLPDPGAAPASSAASSKKGDATSQQPAAGAKTPEEEARALVLAGRKGPMPEVVGRVLEGHDVLYAINEVLIPALDEVGARFEKGTFFLPQLMASAEAAKAGFEAIKAANVAAEGDGAVPSKGKIVICTVHGDIHDIGKNIVRMLLENYGYDVVDLGRDVAPQAVVDAVVADHVKLVGLSALMTTTVPAMAETIELLRKECPWAKVIVGGAVLNPEYAQMVGADYYAKDATETARIAAEVLG